ARVDFQERSQEENDIGQSFRDGSAVFGEGHPDGAQTGRRGDASYTFTSFGCLCSGRPVSPCAWPGAAGHAVAARQLRGATLAVVLAVPTLVLRVSGRKPSTAGRISSFF